VRRLILSVLIDTYNHEKYIEQCVLSAVEQDFPASDYEIVVVDDGSTDRTAEIVERIAARPPRPVSVRLVRKKNGGQASAFNVGVRESRGEVVAFLDGDDWFAPGKLTAVMRALEANPQIAAATHGYHRFEEETKEETVCVPGAEKLLTLATPEAAREALRESRYLLMGALTIRKEMLDRIMPVPEELVFCADGPIALGALAGGVYALDQPLFWYRYHANNLYAAAGRDRKRARRRLRMSERAFECVEDVLNRLGVEPDRVRAFLYPSWIDGSRSGLRSAGGSRLRTFRTEMRAFRLECERPSLRYRLFKYLVVGAGALLLSPQLFYKGRDWYAQRGLGRVRERFASNRGG
jgi:glycosyltransferase involved in cell wall biosynthesis